MDRGLNRQAFYFLLVCIGLAVIAELSFFRGEIGISYFLFVGLFYTVFYIRFKGKLTNQRIGLLIITCILLISGSYGFHDKVLFSVLNLFVIMALSLLVVVLMTGPENIKWEFRAIRERIIHKFFGGIGYSISFIDGTLKLLFKNMDPGKSKAIKQVMLALIVAVPLLTVIIVLLMSADSSFANVVSLLPRYLFNYDFIVMTQGVLIVIVLAGLFFGVFQVLQDEDANVDQEEITADKSSWGSAFGFTILLLLNGIYLLFVLIQFKYFFNGNLQAGFTYAEYARRGFFELLTVTLMNWTILVTFLKKVNLKGNPMKRAMKIMYSILIAVSSIMLVSAFLRLSMYEQAYGFTIDRVLAHAVMLFLFVIFIYTFIHIWLEGLRMTHFYFIFGLLFFTGINVFHVEAFIAEKNWERYEETGKIDVYYMSNLASAGMDVLLRLAETEPDYPDLDSVFTRMMHEDKYRELGNWQSFNLTKYKTIDRIKASDFKNE